MSYFGSKDFYLEVARGNITGVSIVNKFGQNNSITTTREPVAVGGVYQMPTTVSALVVFSSDTNDTSGGTGGQTIVVEGLGAGFVQQSETVTLQGTTSVALSNNWLRVYGMYIGQSGTYANTSAASHVGSITLQGEAGGPVWAKIDSTDGPTGQSQIGAYTVPAGWTAFVDGIQVHVKTAQAADIHGFVRTNADDTTAPYTGVQKLFIDFHGTQDDVALRKRTPYGPYPEATDIWFSAKTSAGTASGAIDFEIILVSTA